MRRRLWSGHYKTLWIRPKPLRFARGPPLYLSSSRKLSARSKNIFLVCRGKWRSTWSTPTHSSFCIDLSKTISLVYSPHYMPTSAPITLWKIFLSSDVLLQNKCPFYSPPSPWLPNSLPFQSREDR
uniref:Uncharacterized protein n=1 Tax=Cacopsylla melanoneura TaxID=428564 RepID=A0A8D8VQ60_9HEMI